MKSLSCTSAVYPTAHAIRLPDWRRAVQIPAQSRISVVPGAAGVTRPLAETAATSAFDEDHWASEVTSRLEPSENAATAVV